MFGWIVSLPPASSQTQLFQHSPEYPWKCPEPPKSNSGKPWLSSIRRRSSSGTSAGDVIRLRSIHTHPCFLLSPRTSRGASRCARRQRCRSFPAVNPSLRMRSVYPECRPSLGFPQSTSAPRSPQLACAKDPATTSPGGPSRPCGEPCAGTLWSGDPWHPP